MTKAEICRAIAERLEPEPKFSPSSVYPDRPNCWSDGGYWLNDGGMFPFNPLGDEDASARLLEAMPHPILECLAGVSDDLRKIWQVRIDTGFFTNPDRKTAIVLAAKDWLGIDGELKP